MVLKRKKNPYLNKLVDIPKPQMFLNNNKIIKLIIQP